MDNRAGLCHRWWTRNFMKTAIEHIIVLGGGKIASDIISHLNASHIDLNVVETEPTKFTSLQNLCNRLQVAFYKKYKRREIIRLLRELTDHKKRVLIVSANNNYIFPEEIIEQRHISIINFHNAILPLNKGRHAATWLIYYEAAEAGVTWHFVDSGIDTGRVIANRTWPIDENESALQLTQTGILDGIDLFKSFIKELLLEGDIVHDDYINHNTV